MRISGITNIFNAFLCMAALVTPASAAVTGTVTDTNVEPLDGATVTFIQEDYPDNFISYVTGSDGAYSINLTVSVDDDSNIPQAFVLGQNYPNPFNPSTTIPFILDNSGNVRLDIFNIMGQHIKTLADGYRNAGSHAVVWDARDKSGNHVSAGIYLYRLRSERSVQSNKMLLLDGGGSSPGAQYTAKPVYNDRSHGAAKITAGIRFNVKVTHYSTLPYEETGITLADGQEIDFEVPLRDGVSIVEGVTLVTIPAGTFRMGDIQNGTDIDALPVHTVTLSSYQMSATEVTQAQYSALTGAIPAEIYVTGDTFPVSYVDWEDAKIYCNLLSDAAGFERCYDSSTDDCDFSKNGFRLPTEAEWEYACRAGTETLYYTGSDESDLDRAAWYYPNSAYSSHEVGQKEPNAWGLYDMLGNVWEWCQDWYGGNYYNMSSPTNPVGPPDGDYPVIRGGGWFNTEVSNQLANRSRYQASQRIKNIGFGFRVVRCPDGMIPGEDSDGIVGRELSFVSIPAVTTPYEMRADYEAYTVESIPAYNISTTEVTNAQYAKYLNSALASGDIETYKDDRASGVTGEWSGNEYISLVGHAGTSPDNECKIFYRNGLFSVKPGNENRPVTWITWYGAKAFAEYYGYDLPTEAEWQYAASGGMNHEYATADGKISPSTVNYSTSFINHPVEVGSYPANPFGLYDMSGNVTEWCKDVSDIFYAPDGEDLYRVLRGGSYKHITYWLRVTKNVARRSSDVESDLGFRVVSH